MYHLFGFSCVRVLVVVALTHIVHVHVPLPYLCLPALWLITHPTTHEFSRLEDETHNTLQSLRQHTVLLLQEQEQEES